MVMTERSLYACLLVLILSGWAAPQASAQDTAQPPCATCVATTILYGQTLLLPEKLHGLTVVLRQDSPAAVEALAAAIEAVQSRGGRAGVLVPPAQGTRAEQAFALKQRITELRSRFGPDVVVVLRAPVDPELTPYIDAVAGQDASDAPPGVQFWRVLPDADVTRALSATTAGGADRWLLDAPDDVLEARLILQDLARAAAPPADAFVEGIEVSGVRRLTAEEIVARHQAFAAGQARRVKRTISTGILQLTFEAPGFPAPVTITSDTVIYAAPGRTELEQREIRVNGLAFKGSGVPRLPILEPERVAAPPLTITLDRFYRYRLVGEERVGGVRCHVIAFEPVDDALTLFRGRAWIAVDSFAMVRVAATQTRLTGAIVSSEQVDDFREVRPGIWLLSRSDVRQLYEGAAHRTPIHRLLTITAHDIDPPDFDARLEAAYRSPSIMLRDTEDGYRYLRRQPAAGDRPQPDAPVVVDVAERADRVRTLAAGLIIDPNISVPLPFAGISYVDFDLFDTGTQLNAFFGGSYAQLAFSIPSLGGTRWQLAGRAFGIATSFNDRSFRNGREIYDENLSQRPAHASAWLLRSISPRLTIRAGYEFDYTRLRRADETAAAFVVPADQVSHGFLLALEGQRAGWAGSLWWNPARRSGWRRWGRTAGDYSPAHADFQRYGARVSRSFPVRPGLVARVEGAFMAGHDLDRFSRYAFGTFDNRLRGYPSALVRYDRGAIVRGSASWALAPLARLDLFVDSAQVRDRGFGDAFRNYTGVGAAIEAPAPFGLLTAVEWGYGFRGRDADGSQGTHVIRLSAFKVF